MSRKDNSSLAGETHPSYAHVENILRKNNGDSASLLAAYPKFNPDSIVPETKSDQRSLEWGYLHYAALHNAPISVMEGLLACGASLKTIGPNGCTVLMNACNGLEKSRAKLVKWILDQPDGFETFRLF